ncbi:Phosphoribosylamine--glycine ligase [Aerococcus viridans]|uniref:Phosphoribosylamine--glycine ligase n=2 Tax=Aerococcus viridans TaxID=1377 RepID=A0AAU8U9F3_9LACT|nr:phosphoribosylamine--glycine ligase [Aerococcus viridans]AMC01285.1 phosphoribosylamine--glycine ligase [Aerococcus viridans]EFG50165.1 phosphoribosylamine--glycine ligase [Aerococcus viridans ATCC 11563 = CCUG 4311]SUU16325.1 Phosphoribosylamine--glycine ligase [Aerococcus viridans]
MKILIIGAGGREHAIAWKLAQSNRPVDIFLAPGNAGTASDYTNVPIDVMDFDRLLDFALTEAIELVIVGPEDPLCAGIVDLFQEAGIAVFGPDKISAQLEASKDLTKQFLNKYQIPTANSFTTADYAQAKAYINQADLPIVIKADGLCKGKGVVICHSLEAAETTLKDMLLDQSFGDSASQVVIEDYLDGYEQSLLCFVSNNQLVPMETAQDYKKAFDGDLGPNTGGVGVYSLPRTPETTDPALEAQIKAILGQIERGLIAEKFSFYGILFIGFMIQDGQAKVLEFNVRFGDPETEVLLPRLESDLLTVFEKTLAGTLKPTDLTWSKQAAVGVVLYSKGYPGAYDNHVAIESLPEGALIFHNGTTTDEAGQLITNGGRVLTPVALADDIQSARQAAYKLVDQIHGASLTYRTDIAKL